MHLIVTVDTEADDQWNEQAGVSVENVYALPRFQTLCEKYGMVPTYLVTYEVAADPKAVEMLKGWQDTGKAEVGAHLHPWTTTPLAEGEGSTRMFPSQLRDDALRAKFTNLTEMLGRAFGRQPTSYRAGRWGFDSRQVALLAEFGYLVDSSVTPSLSWARLRGPDFTKEGLAPHALSSRVLEVPMTILRAGLFSRVRWLRIFERTTKRQLASVVAGAQSLSLPAIVFMIHSSELVAGKSPYVRDEAALARVYTHLESLFVLCKERGIIAATLSDFTRGFHA